MLRPFCWFNAGLLCLLLAGCAGYRPVHHAAPDSVALAPIVNQSDVPQLIAPLGRAVRMALAASSAWDLDAPGESRNLLRITVLERRREAVAHNPDDTGRPVSYFQSLILKLEWEGPSPPPWGPEADRVLEVPTLLYAQPSLVSSESAALAEWSENAAREILALMEIPE